MVTKEQIKELALANGFKLKEQPDGSFDLNPYVYEFAEKLLDLKIAESKPGWYVQDRRGQREMGNSMKFWYKAGYGAKISKFFHWTDAESVKRSIGGCEWHQAWYAPYIDSLAERTVDVQLANREDERAMMIAHGFGV